VCTLGVNVAIYWPSLSFARSWTKTDSRYSVFLSEQAWPIKDLFYAGNGPVRMLRLQLSEEFLNNFGNTRSPQSDLLPLLDRLLILTCRSYTSNKGPLESKNIRKLNPNLRSSGQNPDRTSNALYPISARYRTWNLTISRCVVKLEFTRSTSNDSCSSHESSSRQWCLLMGIWSEYYTLKIGQDLMAVSIYVNASCVWGWY